MTKQSPTYKEKLTALRKIMSEQGIDGFLIPRADEYQGEFVAPYAERLKWLTGFTGSGGAAVVLADKACVLTDGRYLIQVVQQVDNDLYDTADFTKIPVAEWVVEHASKDAVIGYDPWLLTPKQLKAFEEKGITLKAIDNVVDAVWDDQPARPAEPVELFPETLAGQSSTDKRAAIAQQLTNDDLDGFIFTLPDSIAWLLNIRGNDIDYIPLALSYALLERDGSVLWFIDLAKVSVNLGEGVQVVDSAQMADCLKALSGKNIAIDHACAPVWFKDKLEEGDGQAHDFKDPCIAPKSIKTMAEQAAIKAAHIHDGVALVNFLYWLDQEAPKGGLSELDIGVKLRECRAAHAEFRGPSFPTIAGFGANGAIVHYRATPENNHSIKAPGFLLVDSGGQYSGEDFAGTTDITRTIAIGDMTDEMKANFTRVLKGHIAVAAARFKPGTIGKDVDELARAPLKAVDLDYAHGTGHGVGCYLAVHEEAAHISPKGESAFKAGMLISNEPGYYKEGAYGIRIENLVLVCEEGAELCFETVSFAPIDLRAVDVSLLDDDEMTWLNDYHRQIWEKLNAHLSEDAKAWLKDAIAL